MINLLAAHLQEIILVLDDYHLVTAQPVHDAVTFLVEHLPENLHLVIATRADPPLPLARLRARGELAELRLAELRFKPLQAVAFLNQGMRLGLSSVEIDALMNRTEGYRYHRLFSDLLVRQLGRSMPGQMVDLHRSAPTVPATVPGDSDMRCFGAILIMRPRPTGHAPGGSGARSGCIARHP